MFKLPEVFSLPSLKNIKIITVVVLIFIVSIPAIYRLLRPGFFPMYDDMQVIRVEQMDKCIKDGQFPCRWVPDLGYGYGYPLFQYYAPLPYYFMEIVHLIGFSFIDSVKIGFIASIYLSALFFFLLSRKFFSTKTSVVLTFIWVMIPFRAADIYVRGAMGEAWGLIFLPAYLWSFEKLIKDNNFWSFGVFSATGGLLFISHNLTVLMSVPLIGLWFLLRTLQNKKLYKYIILSVFLSLCLSAFYIIPLILGKDLVHIDTTTQGYFNYVNHFSSLKQIFFSTHWGYGPSEFGARDDAFVGIGPLHLILGVLGFIAYIFSNNKKMRLFFTSLFIMAFFYAFLMHERSYPIWSSITFMKYFQFPWRFALISSFVFSFIAGNFFENIPRLLKPFVYILIILTTLILYGNYFAPKEWLDITDQDKLSGNNRQLAVTASIYDYLPKSASVNPKDPAPESLIIESGSVDVNSFERGSNWYRYEVEVKTDSVKVVVPVYDFPGWVVFDNKEKIKYQRFGELGLISFVLEGGYHQLYIKLNKVSVMIVSDIVSLTSFGLLIGTLSIERFRKKGLV